jgi:hypothetical protein
VRSSMIPNSQDRLLTAVLADPHTQAASVSGGGYVSVYLSLEAPTLGEARSMAEEVVALALRSSGLDPEVEAGVTFDSEGNPVEPS